MCTGADRGTQCVQGMCTGANKGYTRDDSGFSYGQGFSETVV